MTEGEHVAQELGLVRDAPLAVSEIARLIGLAAVVAAGFIVPGLVIAGVLG